MKRAFVAIRKEPAYRREAIVAGLTNCGFALVCKEFKPTDNTDWLVLWNRKRGTEEDLAERWESKGGSVIVMENGYLQKVDKTMYAISVGQHNGAGWSPVGNEDRFVTLGFEVKPWDSRPGSGHILVCGQRGIGSSLMASPPQWAEKVVKRLSVDPNRWKMRHRPHPGNFAPKTSLVGDLKEAMGCMIWSSASGVRALVEGVPVSYAAPHWICSAGATRYSGKDAAVFLCDDHLRNVALHCMSHGQWAVAEIAAGEPFKRILENLEHATWA